VDLTHRFTVPTGVEETWAHFQDIASVAQCFPGATVTEADSDSFSGTVKVKLGPIALLYKGQGTFTERDEAAHSFKVDAQGKDKRGNGTAGAKVTLSMSEGAGGATDVEVLTDLNVTGKPAQFGRGVMQDVSDKLLGQFVSCLEQRLAAAPEDPTLADVTSSAASTASGDPQAAAAQETVTAVQPEAPATEQAISPTDPASPETPGPTPLGDAAAASAASSPGGAGTTSPGAPPAAAPRRTTPPSPPAAGGDDALDLGATVLPVLLKSYWKQAAGVLGVLVVLRWLLGRR